MKNSSKNSFKIGYLIDTFPRRTENFILREISGVLKHWPNLRVYCFKSNPSDWEFVDCKEDLQDIPQTSISMHLFKILFTHLKNFSNHPIKYLNTLWESIKLYKNIYAFRRFDQAVRLARLVKQDGITHIHAHFASEPAVVAFLASKLLSITYSISAHAEDIWARKPFDKVMENASCCLTCTNEGKKYLENEFPLSNVHLVYHGYHLKEEEYQQISKPDIPPLKIISGGRLIHKKGFDTLIDACSILSQKDIDYQCDIYGEGELEKKLKDQIKIFKVQDRVKVHPFAPHAKFKEFLSQSHLFVLPCRIDPHTGNQDGIPNVILEAMACKTIVIASDLPTIKEIIEDKVTGFLTEPDNPAHLAKTILEVSNHWSKQNHIFEKAQNSLFTRFNPNFEINSLVKIIQKDL